MVLCCIHEYLKRTLRRSDENGGFGRGPWQLICYGRVVVVPLSHSNLDPVYNTSSRRRCVCVDIQHIHCPYQHIHCPYQHIHCPYRFFLERYKQCALKTTAHGYYIATQVSRVDNTMTREKNERNQETYLGTEGEVNRMRGMTDRF